MIRKDAEKLVVDSICEHLDLSYVDMTTNLRSLKADSLDVVQICIIMESKTGLEIKPPKMLKDIQTVSDLVRLVEVL